MDDYYKLAPGFQTWKTKLKADDNVFNDKGIERTFDDQLDMLIMREIFLSHVTEETSLRGMNLVSLHASTAFREFCTTSTNTSVIISKWMRDFCFDILHIKIGPRPPPYALFGIGLTMSISKKNELLAFMMCTPSAVLFLEYDNISEFFSDKKAELQFLEHLAFSPSYTYYLCD